MNFGKDLNCILENSTEKFLAWLKKQQAQTQENSQAVVTTDLATKPDVIVIDPTEVETEKFASQVDQQVSGLAKEGAELLEELKSWGIELVTIGGKAGTFKSRLEGFVSKVKGTLQENINLKNQE